MWRRTLQNGEAWFSRVVFILLLAVWLSAGVYYLVFGRNIRAIDGWCYFCLVSPLILEAFVFSGAGRELSCAAAVIVLALLSWLGPTRHAHVGSVAVGVWMITFAYLHSGDPTPSALQNNALVGMLLIMFGVIPNQASLPPARWRDYELPCEESNP